MEAIYMRAFANSGLPVFKWLGILPEIGALVGSIVQAAQDGRIDAVEVADIGAKLVAIVAQVV